MLHNDSHKHESIFTSVTVQENNSVMLSSLSGSTLGVWVSHGEGKFNLPMGEENYNIVAKYGYENYPANLMDPTLIPRCYAIQQVVTW
jgi:phosphoribosylformylglycinamidine synthase